AGRSKYGLRGCLHFDRAAGRLGGFLGKKSQVTSATHKSSVRTAVLTIPLLLAAVAALQMRIDAGTLAMARPSQQLLVRSGAALKKLSLGYNALLADIYWTRAVQYYGVRVQQPGSNYDLLWPLLDVATTLDPHLLVAYRFGAIFLSEPYAG